MSDIPDDCKPISFPWSGWTKLYHKSGALVTLPVAMERLDYKALFDNVTAALDAGFLVQAPGLEEGEEKEQVGWVLRGGFEKEGQITPFVLLYAANDTMTWSFLKVYLNKKEDVEAFEYAARVKLDALTDYVGNDKPQRTASIKTDKFIVPVPKPFGVVFKKNPKHNDTEEGKMKPARLFVRWADQKPAAEPKADAPAEAPAQPPATGESMTKNMEAIGQWRDYAAGVKDGLDLNSSLPEIRAIKSESVRKTVWGIVKQRAEAMGCVWDATGNSFVKKHR